METALTMTTLSFSLETGKIDNRHAGVSLCSCNLITTQTVMEEDLLQQAFRWASFQHVRDDDGGLATLKMRVIPTS